MPDAPSLQRPEYGPGRVGRMPPNLRPYAEMKDSGIEWLGPVPAQWELRRTKTLLAQRSEKGAPDAPLLAATQTKGVVRKEEYENRTVLALKDLHLLKRVHTGDFVISLRSFQGGIEYAREDGIISPAYTILYPFEESYHAFLAILFKTKPYVDNLSLYVTGIRQGQNIDYEKLARSWLPLPSESERHAIARFLAHADRRIRRYIHTKEKLIAVLEEQKQVIIHGAVTGQVNARTRKAYPAYKPSGLSWVKEIPKHWEVLPLKRAFSQIDYGISETATDEGAIPLLTMGHIRDGEVSIPDYGGVREVDASLLLEDKDLLFNRTNSAELVAKVGLFRSIQRPVTFASYLVRMRACEGNIPEFLSFLLNDIGFIAGARREAIPSLHQVNLNPTRYGRLRIPLPPRREQIALVEYIQEISALVGTAVKTNERRIACMKEYWSRLVNDIVTGKLDVREASSMLPEADDMGEEADDGLPGTVASSFVEPESALVQSEA